ncbi:MAG: DUF131 domain-containing protein [Thermosphaera sp.]
MDAFQMILIGLALIIAGFAVLMFSAAREERGEGRVEAGGLVMIGPIPILVATSKKIGLILLLATAVFLIALLILAIGIQR